MTSMPSSARERSTSERASHPDDFEATFGERARALEPRALLAGRTASAWDADDVRVAFRSGALSPTEREALRGLDVRSGADGLDELRTSAAAMRELVAHEPALFPLQVAHELATRPPRPPRIMGIVNVTPDSFSDGGLYREGSKAIDHGLALEAAGADVLDVGGESTRPGADDVTEEEELARVLPVVEGLRAASSIPISVDTTKAEVARRALDAGATMVNDVSAGSFDANMLRAVAEAGCDFVLMHMQGRPRDMQVAPSYDDPVREIARFLRERVAACWKAGIAAPRIVLDPGIGFGKRLEDNLALIRALPELRSLGRPLLLGVSRKSFLHHLGGPAEAAQRGPETGAAVTACALFGAELHRVHDVEEAGRALRLASALMAAKPKGPSEPTDRGR